MLIKPAFNNLSYVILSKCPLEGHIRQIWLYIFKNIKNEEEK
jgi:hypothetical protein